MTFQILSDAFCYGFLDGGLMGLTFVVLGIGIWAVLKAFKSVR